MKRLECLDGLRGVLAVYVMLGHMAPFAAVPEWAAHPLSHGSAAVDVFFILSGLVILRSLEGVAYGARPFLIARVARIYPLYLLLFAASVAVQPVPIDYGLLPWVTPDSPARDIWSMGWPSAWAGQIAAHLVMLHGLFPAGVLPGTWVSFLGSAWSLSTEWQFYVVALFAGRRLGPAGLAALLLGLAATALAWRASAPEAWQFTRAFLPNKAHFFALGIASAMLLRGGPGAVRRYGIVLGAAVLGCLLQGGPAKALPALFWTFCLAMQMHPAHALMRWPARALRLPVVQRLGVLSYGIYLVNEPVQKLLGIALAQAAGGDPAAFTVAWVPGALLLPVLVAAALHRWIEQPGLRAGRALVRRMDGTPARRALRLSPP